VQKDFKGAIEVEIDDDLMKESHLTLKRPYKNKGKSKVSLKANELLVIPFRNKDVIIPQNLKIPKLQFSTKE
jgi:hypothetical protein